MHIGIQTIAVQLSRIIRQRTDLCYLIEFNLYRHNECVKASKETENVFAFMWK